METTKKSNEFEPTLLDVLEAVQTGFAKIEGQLGRHENILVTLQEGQDNFREILNERTTAQGVIRNSAITTTSCE